MGPTWGPSGADRTQVGPMLAPLTLLSGKVWGVFCWFKFWRTFKFCLLLSVYMQHIAVHKTAIYQVYSISNKIRKNYCDHGDIIKWKHFLHYWPFVQGIPRSPVNSPHKSQWGGALMFTLICTQINVWVNTRVAGDFILHRAHYDAIVMIPFTHEKTYDTMMNSPAKEEKMIYDIHKFYACTSSKYINHALAWSIVINTIIWQTSATGTLTFCATSTDFFSDATLELVLSHLNIAPCISVSTTYDMPSCQTSFWNVRGDTIKLCIDFNIASHNCQTWLESIEKHWCVYSKVFFFTQFRCAQNSSIRIFSCLALTISIK